MAIREAEEKWAFRYCCIISQIMLKVDMDTDDEVVDEDDSNQCFPGEKTWALLDSNDNVTTPSNPLLPPTSRNWHRSCKRHLH